MMKTLTLAFFVAAFVVAGLIVSAHAEPKGSLGLGRSHGFNAGASQSGCGSSWAICQYRRQGKARDQGLQRRLAGKCNRAPWMDVCR